MSDGKSSTACWNADGATTSGWPLSRTTPLATSAFGRQGRRCGYTNCRTCHDRGKSARKGGGQKVGRDDVGRPGEMGSQNHDHRRGLRKIVDQLVADSNLMRHPQRASSSMTSSSSGVSKEFNQSTLGGRRRHSHWNRQRDRRTRVRQNCLVHKHNRWRRASTHVRYLSRCRSRRLAKSSRSGRLGGGSDHLRSTGHDAHLHLHSEVIRRKSKKGAVKRDRVARIGHGRNGDQADVADAAAPTRE